ncbi:MAG: hypothetical protein KAU83_01655 [Bacteroidales bacterium]|nr:hypothetical protein [Bacteroidales bacterium]
MLNRRLNITALILVFVMLISMVAFTAYEPFKVKLGLFDRLVALALLPPEGSYATLKIVREMQMELAPSEEESKAAGIIDDLLTGGVQATLGWDKVEDKEIVFGDIAKALIVSALEKLDKEEKLTQQHFNLYRWFVLGEKQEKEEIKEGD